MERHARTCALAPAARAAVCASLLLAAAAARPPAAMPQTVSVDPERVVVVPRGKSFVLTHARPLDRVAVADPEVAEAVVVSPREVLVNARTVGATSLVVWDATGMRTLYGIDVTADPDAVERQLRAAFPGEPIEVAATGGTLFLSGTVSSDLVAHRALELARTTGATVVDNLVAPEPQQVLLQAIIAEVSRDALERIGTDLIIGDGTEREGTDFRIETFASEGVARFFLFDEEIEVAAILDALKSRGLFKTLAEPNLLALPGEEASFLAGGEFPYPVVQPGGDFAAITIEFKEFGVRLRFVPAITAAGTVHLDLATEVSDLNFARGLVVSGFQVPSLQTRRAETAVELEPGQYLAIAGLIDNSIDVEKRKIPILGHIPILGWLFRFEEERQERTELLILVTPSIVTPTGARPALPTGEAEEWKWDRHLRERRDPPERRR